jgi:hypothetical protein
MNNHISDPLLEYIKRVGTDIATQLEAEAVCPISQLEEQRNQPNRRTTHTNVQRPMNERNCKPYSLLDGKSVIAIGKFLAHW